MRYCTQTDLLRAIPRETLTDLSNDEAGAVEPDWEVVEALVAGAEEHVDAALRGRYALPLPEAPALLRDLTVNLARHALYLRRPEGRDLPEAVVHAYKAGLETLAAVRDGRLHLGVPGGAPVGEPGAVRVSAPARRFGADTLERY